MNRLLNEAAVRRYVCSVCGKSTFQAPGFGREGRFYRSCCLECAQAEDPVTGHSPWVPIRVEEATAEEKEYAGVSALAMDASYDCVRIQEAYWTILLARAS